MIGGLAYVQEHAAAQRRAPAQKVERAYTGVDRACAAAIRRELSQGEREFARFERLGDRHLIAVDDRGALARLAHQKRIERVADPGDKGEVCPDILVRLHRERDRQRPRQGIQRERLWAVVVEQLEILGLKAGDDAAVRGKYQRRYGNQANLYPYGGILRRQQRRNRDRKRSHLLNEDAASTGRGYGELAGVCERSHRASVF